MRERMREWLGSEIEHWREVRIGLYKGYGVKQTIREVLIAHFGWSLMFLLLGNRSWWCRAMEDCNECWKEV